MIKKVDTITIKVRGTKKFRQIIIDLIYAALMDENINFEATKSDSSFTLESPLVPSDEGGEG